MGAGQQDIWSSVFYAKCDGYSRKLPGNLLLSENVLSNFFSHLGGLQPQEVLPVTQEPSLRQATNSIPMKI